MRFQIPLISSGTSFFIQIAMHYQHRNGELRFRVCAIGGESKQASKQHGAAAIPCCEFLRFQDDQCRMERSISISLLIPNSNM